MNICSAKALFQWFSLLHISSFLSLMLLSSQSLASINYISLHDVSSQEQMPLLVRLNIVADTASAPQLRFVLNYQNKKSSMRYQFINQFMVRVKSEQLVNGLANIDAYVAEEGAWRHVANIKLPKVDNRKYMVLGNIADNTEQRTKPEKEQENRMSSEKSSIKPKNSLELSVDKQTTSAKVNFDETPLPFQENCLLNNLPRETLWTIASHFKDKWKTSIYGAMVAIYHANKAKFTHGSIERLVFGNDLRCPSDDVLRQLKSKPEMKEIYQSLK